MATNNDWKRIAVDQLRQGRKVTEYRGINRSNVPYVEHPNYDVYAYNPDAIKNPDDEYLISGTESQIILQSSLLTALYELLGKQLGYTINFDDWFNDFSYEFKYDLKNNKLRVTENKKNITYWGRTKEDRPSYYWLDNTDKTYKVIKFFPNRKNQNVYHIFGGTESEVRSHLLLLMSLENIDSGTESIPSKKVFTELKQLSSSPCIYLLFREENIPEGEYRKLEAECTIALIDCVENSKFKTRASDKVLGVPELKQYKKIIEQNFLPTLETPYILEKGHETYTYANWRQGYHTWLPFLNRSSAIDFYTKMCAIKGDIFDDINLYEGRVSQKKIDKPEEKIYTMGEQVTLPKYRRKGSCKFWKAYLWLPMTRQKIVLVSRSRKDPVDPRLL